MPRRSVSPSIDANRLALAVQRPGIDPRIWGALAVATGDSQLDPDHGAFVEVKILPSGEEFNCYLPADYAGNQFGENKGGVKKDDQLFIAVPNGDPAEGGVVLARFHSETDKPGQLAISFPADHTLELEPGKSWRLKVSGDGVLAVIESPGIRLGDAAAAESFVLGNTYRTEEAAANNAVAAAHNADATLATAIVALGAALSPVVALLPPPNQAALTAALLTISTAGPAAAAADTAAGTAVTTMEGKAATFLSAVIKGK